MHAYFQMFLKIHLIAFGFQNQEIERLFKLKKLFFVEIFHMRIRFRIQKFAVIGQVVAEISVWTGTDRQT